MKVTISSERTIQGIRLSTILGNQYIHKHYIGYSKREAMSEFKEYLREEYNMKTENEFKHFYKEINPELIEVLKRIHKNTYWLDPDLKENDDCDPAIQITISCDDDLTRWNIQTGDNSYTGSCYGDPKWGVGYLREDSNFEDLADELIEDLFNQFY